MHALCRCAIQYSFPPRRSQKCIGVIGLVANQLRTKTNIRDDVCAAEPSRRLRLLRALHTWIVLLLLTAGAAMLFGARWFLHTWPFLSVDEMKFHMNAPITGTDPDIVRSGVLNVVVPAAAVFVIGVAVYALGKKLRRQKRAAAMLAAAGALTLVIGTGSLWHHLNLTSYFIYGHIPSELIEAEYVAPESAHIRFPAQKRNLIYIFLESMEITFADKDSGGAFNRNVIPELTNIALSNECFAGNTGVLNGAHQSTGSGWTAGGMFAQSSGLPFPSSLGNNVKVRNNAFLPEVVALGDVLKDAGYRCVLMVGSDAEFGWRGYYYRSHGDYSILDYPFFLSTGDLPKGYAVWWGYEDEKLFSFARNELLTLCKADRPFALTLLTVDTHFEDGYVCRRCSTSFGSDQYSNVMACSSRQLASFLRWCSQQDFYKNTTIVLCGDHLTMDSDYCAKVSPKYDRRVYTAIINADVTPVLDKARVYFTLDLFPTTLTAIGAEFDGDRLGLGTDLYSDSPTLAEEYGINAINSEFYKYSETLHRLTDWDSEDAGMDG